ncbi:MAG: DUF1802 family protein [Acidobacteriota bacterium]
MQASLKLACKEWSVICRTLREGSAILTFFKEFDESNREFLLLPSYDDQKLEALKPHVSASWRHVLKAPLEGHNSIRDCAEVVEVFSIRSPDRLKTVQREHALTLVELESRLRQGGEPRLIALALRVYHLPRSFKIYDRKEYEGGERFVSLPEEVSTEGAVAAVSDEDFERRLAAVRRALRPAPATS